MSTLFLNLLSGFLLMKSYCIESNELMTTAAPAAICVIGRHLARSHCLSQVVTVFLGCQSYSVASVAPFMSRINPFVHYMIVSYPLLSSR